MTFRTLDNLFRNSPGAYQQLLEFIHSEFGKAQEKLIKSLEEYDGGTFSHIRHKLSSTLNTLEYNELISLLSELKESFDQKAPIDSKKEVEKINLLFHTLLDRMKEKITEIEELKVM